jgi:hypothetical protein
MSRPASSASACCDKSSFNRHFLIVAPRSLSGLLGTVSHIGTASGKAYMDYSPIGLDTMLIARRRWKCGPMKAVVGHIQPAAFWFLGELKGSPLRIPIDFWAASKFYTAVVNRTLGNFLPAARWAALLMLDNSKERRERLARRLFAAVMAEEFSLASADEIYFRMANRDMGNAWLQIADQVLEWKEHSICING